MPQSIARMISRCGFLLLLLLGAVISSAQELDSIPPPLKQKQKPVVTPMEEVDLLLPEQQVRTYVPRQALLWSIVPGGGQVYNRRWWKVPLVFSAFSGVVAVLDFNQSNYERFRDAYQAELAGQEHEFSSLGYSADALLSLRRSFNKQRQTNYFMLFAVYLLQGVEAYVDTHLRNFDMDEDLSQWQIRPHIVPGLPGQVPATVALQVQYSF
jgi:hypothetical protein